MHMSAMAALTHCGSASPNSIIVRSQQQQQCVYWGSSPVSAMKQLELTVLSSAPVLQPARLRERLCNSSSCSSRPCAGASELPVLDSGLPGLQLCREAPGGATLLGARAVQQDFPSTPPGPQGAVMTMMMLMHGSPAQQQTVDDTTEQAAAEHDGVGFSSSRSSDLVVHHHHHHYHGSTPQQLRARLYWMQAKHNKQKHNHQKQQQQQQAGSTLHALLAEHQQVHLQGLQQPDAAGERVLPAADGHRLDRKLTAILTDSCISWNDVAAVLLAADSAGRLNGVHLAAALATLVRLKAADKATRSSVVDAAREAGSRPVGSSLATSVVPVTRQQAKQIRHVRQAAATAIAAGFGSRWNIDPTHIAATAAAAGTGAVSATASDQLGMDSCVAVEHGAESVPADEEQQQQLLDVLCLAVADHWHLMSAATMTSCCWSLANLGQVLPQSVLPQVGQVLLDMAQLLNCSSDGRSMQHSSCSSSSQQAYGLHIITRQLVVMLWSLAKMSVEPQDLQQQNSRQQQEQGGGDTMRSTQQQQQQQQQWVAEPQPGQQAGGVVVVDHVVRALSVHSPVLSSQGLVMLWWALATWSTRLTPHTAAALLDATATRVAQQSFISRGLAVTLWAVARLGLTPDAAWLAAWLAAMRAALPAANSHDCAVSAWALARLGVPPPGEWLAALSWRAAAVARQLRPQELPALLWGVCRLGFRPSLLVVQQLLQRGLVLAGRGELSPQGLALTLWATAGLGLQPKAVWTDALLAAAGEYLPLFRAVECSGLLVALVRLQHIPHQAWMDLWWQETQGKLATADGQQLVLLLWGAVQLGQAPPAPWFDEWKRCSMQAMAAGHLTAQGYGLVWHALLQLEVSPGSSWLDTYWKASNTADVRQTLDCITAERTLVALAALAQHQQGSVRPPAHWMVNFVAATQQQLVTAKMVNVCTMLQAAGQLQMLLPGNWLRTAMTRLEVLLQSEGVIPSAPGSSSSSSERRGGGSDQAQTGPMAGTASKGHVSSNLAARLRRRWLAVRLKQALEGLRAQQMLAQAAQAAAAQRSRQASPSAAAAAAGQGYVVDALATWPWLSDAVMATWPNRLSAMQALQGLSGVY